MVDRLLYRGASLRLVLAADGVAELCFDAAATVNKFDAATRHELREAVDSLGAESAARGLMLTSARDSFVVGADITEFLELFESPGQVFEADMRRMHRLFADIEDLPLPTVAVINGAALGGGFEVCLACDFRVMAPNAVVGLPEIQLGIFPGWGGTIRLPRLIGIEKAVDWIASGRSRNGAAALADGAVDAVVEVGALHDAARRWLESGQSGQARASRRQRKRLPMAIDRSRREQLFEGLRSRLADRIDPHYPALGIAIDAMARHTGLPRDEAIPVEIAAFIEVSKTPAAASLVRHFLNDRLLDRQARQLIGDVGPPLRVGVFGANGAGAEVALGCVLANLPVVLVDPSEAALEGVAGDFRSSIDARADTRRFDAGRRSAMQDLVLPMSSMESLGDCDFVVICLPEGDADRAGPVGEIAACTMDDAVIAVHDPVRPIGDVAGNLRDPGRLLGLHLAALVPESTMIEVVRGHHTSTHALARGMALARTMGRKPVVVRDSPGLLLSRVLRAYLKAFESLLSEGIEFSRIDRVMEDFGWPMGPASLIDRIGIEIVLERSAYMAAVGPGCVESGPPGATRMLKDAGRFGRGNGLGYYRYPAASAEGPCRLEDAEAREIVAGCVTSPEQSTDEEILARLTTSMCAELACCLEEGVVDSPQAADMALVWGLGYPRHAGSALGYIGRR